MNYNSYSCLSNEQRRILAKEDRKEKEKAQKKNEKIKSKKLVKKSLKKEKSKKHNEIQCKKFAKKLTEKATRAELILKQLLEERNIRFDFQLPVSGWDRMCIVDFMIYCRGEKNLIIELDGNQHYTDEGLKKDAERSKWLRRYMKVKIKRYHNQDVYKRPFAIIEYILKFGALTN